MACLVHAKSPLCRRRLPILIKRHNWRGMGSAAQQRCWECDIALRRAPPINSVLNSILPITRRQPKQLFKKMILATLGPAGEFVVGWGAQLRYLADEVGAATPLDRRIPRVSMQGGSAELASCLW